MQATDHLAALKTRIEELEIENALLKRDFGSITKGSMVIVPDGIKPLFEDAQAAVSEYFRNLKMEPTKGTIEINDQRYVLVRASALSKDFLDTIQKLYADRGEAEAMMIGKNFLFDISHVIGMNDARAFHKKMNFTEPLPKLSAGPIHFAYSGWAFVEILPESNPSPDEDFYLLYNHPYSFEADSWVRSGTRSSTPVCIMNAGYSSGWCEQSFGLPLTAVEVSCIAKGDEHCTFIMSPPHRIQEHLNSFNKEQGKPHGNGNSYEVPTFFERKLVEEEMQRARLLAEESVKAKSDFVANMSHELRTPLGAILGFADLMKRTDLDAVQQDYLSAIHTSGNNLLSIINDVLDLSKLDAGRFVIEHIPFSIPELIHSVEVMFGGKAAEKSLKLDCYVDPVIESHVLGDPMRLTQILTNLIGNAIKFTEEGGLSVSCIIEDKSDDSYALLFTVSDTGVGIPADKAEHVFQRFTQGDTDITRKYGGTGLGLAITRQLVELQGGSITLEPGTSQGVTFHVRLKYTLAPEAEPHAQGKQSELPALAGTHKILVVEDNYMNRKLTTIILENNGYEPTMAENGALAVDLLKHERFDAILMDLQMPVMDGYKATCAIRDELHLSTPIIAMTAHALDGERDNCIHKGMNDYIAKPFREEDLLKTLHHWLSGKDRNAQAVSASIIDFSFLKKQTRNNKAFIKEMIHFFREHNPGEIASLEAAISTSDYPDIFGAAHRLRNTTGFFGLNTAIGSQLLRIEQLARAGEGIEEIAGLLPEVKRVFAQAIFELSDPDVITFV